jgi:hypothetical protein
MHLTNERIGLENSEHVYYYKQAIIITPVEDVDVFWVWATCFLLVLLQMTY